MPPTKPSARLLILPPGPHREQRRRQPRRQVIDACLRPKLHRPTETPERARKILPPKGARGGEKSACSSKAISRACNILDLFEKSSRPSLPEAQQSSTPTKPLRPWQDPDGPEWSC